jgi:hypothetical protein
MTLPEITIVITNINRAVCILDTSNYRVLKWQFGGPLCYLVARGRGTGSQLYYMRCFSIIKRIFIYLIMLINKLHYGYQQTHHQKY